MLSAGSGLNVVWKIPNGFNLDRLRETLNSKSVLNFLVQAAKNALQCNGADWNAQETLAKTFTRLAFNPISSRENTLNFEAESSRRGRAGRGGAVLPYMSYLGMCDPKGYGCPAVFVINGVSILAILVINRLWFLHKSR